MKSENVRQSLSRNDYQLVPFSYVTHMPAQITVSHK